MNLYRGVFVYPHKPVIIQLQAVSERQGWARMIRQMAKRDDVTPGMVFGLFPWNKRGENFTIEIITCKLKGFGDDKTKTTSKRKP